MFLVSAKDGLKLQHMLQKNMQGFLAMVTSKNGKLLKIQIYKKNAKSAGTKYDTI